MATASRGVGRSTLTVLGDGDTRKPTSRRHASSSASSASSTSARDSLLSTTGLMAMLNVNAHGTGQGSKRDSVSTPPSSVTSSSGGGGGGGGQGSSSFWHQFSSSAPSGKKGKQKAREMAYNRDHCPYPLVYRSLDLHQAASTGNLGLVKFALEGGQPVNSVLGGILPLHVAAAGGHLDVVRMLIHYGADVNAPRLPRDWGLPGQIESASPIALTVSDLQMPVGTAGSTPLHFACANGHKAVVKELLLSDADATLRDRHGFGPLALAQGQNYVGIERLVRTWALKKGVLSKVEGLRSSSESTLNAERRQARRSSQDSSDQSKDGHADVHGTPAAGQSAAASQLSQRATFEMIMGMTAALQNEQLSLDRATAKFRRRSHNSGKRPNMQSTLRSTSGSSTGSETPDTIRSLGSIVTSGSKNVSRRLSSKGSSASSLMDGDKGKSSGRGRTPSPANSAILERYKRSDGVSSQSSGTEDEVAEIRGENTGRRLSNAMGSSDWTLPWTSTKPSHAVTVTLPNALAAQAQAHLGNKSGQRRPSLPSIHERPQSKARELKDVSDTASAARAAASISTTGSRRESQLPRLSIKTNPASLETGAAELRTPLSRSSMASSPTGSFVSLLQSPSALSTATAEDVLDAALEASAGSSMREFLYEVGTVAQAAKARSMDEQATSQSQDRGRHEASSSSPVGSGAATLLLSRHGSHVFDDSGIPAARPVPLPAARTRSSVSTGAVSKSTGPELQFYRPRKSSGLSGRPSVVADAEGQEAASQNASERNVHRTMAGTDDSDQAATNLKHEDNYSQDPIDRANSQSQDNDTGLKMKAQGHLQSQRKSLENQRPSSSQLLAPPLPHEVKPGRPSGPTVSEGDLVDKSQEIYAKRQQAIARQAGKTLASPVSTPAALLLAPKNRTYEMRAGPDTRSLRRDSSQDDRTVGLSSSAHVPDVESTSQSHSEPGMIDLTDQNFIAAEKPVVRRSNETTVETHERAHDGASARSRTRDSLVAAPPQSATATSAGPYQDPSAGAMTAREKGLKYKGPVKPEPDASEQYRSSLVKGKKKGFWSNLFK